MVSCLCPCRRLVKVVRLGVVVSAVVAAVRVAQADYQVAPVAAVVADAVHAEPVVTSPELVLCEPVAAVARLADYQVAPVAVVVRHAALALPRVHPAAAVAPVAPDVQLAQHEPDARCAVAAGVARFLHRVAVVRPRAAALPVVAVPLFVLPAAEARCLDPDPGARLAPRTSVPSRDRGQDSRASPLLSPDGTAVQRA